MNEKKDNPGPPFTLYVSCSILTRRVAPRCRKGAYHTKNENSGDKSYRNRRESTIISEEEIDDAEDKEIEDATDKGGGLRAKEVAVSSNTTAPEIAVAEKAPSYSCADAEAKDATGSNSSMANNGSARNSPLAASASVKFSQDPREERVARSPTPPACQLLTVNSVIPENAPMRKCYIVRSKNGVLGGNIYSMFEEPPGDGEPGGGEGHGAASSEKRFLLCGKKKTGTKRSTYLISDSCAANFNEGKTSIVGKLKGNWTGGSYIIYSGDGRNRGEGKGHKAELGVVQYDYDKMGPGKVKAFMPLENFALSNPSRNLSKSISKRRSSLAPTDQSEENGSDSSPLPYAQLPDNLAGCVEVCVNKRPHWDAAQKGHVLNFNGRVTLSSVKNFQLVNSSSRVMLQFGRVRKNVFTVDYGWPASAVQAFAICLSSLDRKIADSKGYELIQKYRS